MTIGELAERAGLAASTIRYYEEVKLLPRPVRARGRRVFDDTTPLRFDDLSIDELLIDFD